MSQTLSSIDQRDQVPNNIKIFLFILLLSFSYDVRDEIGVSIFQLLSTIMFFLSSGVLIFILFVKPKHSKFFANLYNTSFIWWIYLAVTLLSAIYTQISIIFYLKTVFPILIIGIIYLIFIGLINNNYQYTFILKYLFFASLVSIVITFINSYLLYSTSFIDIRFRIASISIWFVISYSLANIFFNPNIKTAKIIYALIFIISVILFFYSLTRVYIISFMCIMASILFISYFHQTKYKLFSLKNILISSVVIFLIFTILLQIPLFSEFVDRWIFRLTDETVKTGAPLTFILRLARIQGQLSVLFENTQNMLLGVGFGQPYQASPEFFSTIQFNKIFLDYFTMKQLYPTDYTWVHYLYYNGIIFGGIFIIVVLKTMLSSFILVKNLNYFDNNLKLINITIFVSLMAYLGNSIASNLFEFRFLAIILGFLFSITNYHNDLIKIAKS